MSDWKNLDSSTREYNTAYCPQCNKLGKFSDLRLCSYPPINFMSCESCKIKWQFRGCSEDVKAKEVLTAREEFNHRCFKAHIQGRIECLEEYDPDEVKDRLSELQMTIDTFYHCFPQFKKME